MKTGSPFQKEDEVEALFGSRAELELPGRREDVRFVELLDLGVQAARRPEVRKAERHPVGLDTLSKDLESAPPFDLRGEPVEQPVLCLRSKLLLEALPLPGLSGVEKLEDVV